MCSVGDGWDCDGWDWDTRDRGNLCVGDVKIIKSIDKVFGLDEEAIKTAKEWRFRPGRRLGEPVPVIVTIELSFTLR